MFAHSAKLSDLVPIVNRLLQAVLRSCIEVHLKLLWFVATTTIQCWLMTMFLNSNIDIFQRKCLSWSLNVVCRRRIHEKTLKSLFEKQPWRTFTLWRLRRNVTLLRWMATPLRPRGMRHLKSRRNQSWKSQVRAHGLFPFYILIYLIIIVNLSLTNLSFCKNKL